MAIKNTIIQSNIRPDEVVKLAIVGDAGVGKTSYIQSLLKNKPILNQSPTMGISFNTVIVEDVNDVKIKVNIWDTAGQDRFRSIIKLYLKNVDGIILMYDTYTEKVNENLSLWLNTILEEGENIYVLVVFNKTDIIHKNKESNINDGKDFCKKHNLIFKESSVKNFENIKDVILSLIQTIRTNPDNKDVRDLTFKSNVVLDFNSETKRQSYCC